MTIYLAGKITGDPDYRAKFFSADMGLCLKGHQPINPSVLPQGLGPADYIGICVPMLLAADAAVFLPDWKDSPGARIERAICEYIGMQIIDLADNEDGDGG